MHPPGPVRGHIPPQPANDCSSIGYPSFPSKQGHPSFSLSLIVLVLYVPNKAGMKRVDLVNRTSATAERVKDDLEVVFEFKIAPSLQTLPEKPESVIGTVPVDTTTDDQFSLDQGLCIDMSYKPRKTPLLMAAQQIQR